MNFLRSFLGHGVGLRGADDALVKRRWLRTLIWALAACLVVFFYGDALRLRPLAAVRHRPRRISPARSSWLGWAAYNVVHGGARPPRQQGDDHGDDRRRQAPDKSDLSAQELDQMRTRLQEAMTQLRKVVGGRRGYVYQLPWYIMIGPPGSGKTTALLNSGLKFPLADTLGQEPLRGVGGTRNCDWWFTEDAILLDTAGRYTTQDSDPELDRQGWPASSTC